MVVFHQIQQKVLKMVKELLGFLIQTIPLIGLIKLEQLVLLVLDLQMHLMVPFICILKHQEEQTAKL